MASIYEPRDSEPGPLAGVSVVDLKHDEGREVFYRLVERADMVVENFRADVKRRLAIQYERLSAINPRLV
jgi:crotonobetainyl-CoA:carnitine CoA-transferase CaiB-like acyl-CoA transferase